MTDSDEATGSADSVVNNSPDLVIAGEGGGEAAVQTLLPPPGDQRVLGQREDPQLPGQGMWKGITATRKPVSEK